MVDVLFCLHSCLEFRFRVGVRTLALHLSRSQVCSSVHVCFVVLHAVRVFIGCVHLLYLVLVLYIFHVVLCEHVAYEFSH